MGEGGRGGKKTPPPKNSLSRTRKNGGLVKGQDFMVLPWKYKFNMSTLEHLVRHQRLSETGRRKEGADGMKASAVGKVFSQIL